MRSVIRKDWFVCLSLALLVLALIWLGGVVGCASVPAVAVKTFCLPLKPYTASDQNAAAAELSAWPNHPTITRFILDYEAMRDADRACMVAAGAAP